MDIVSLFSGCGGLDLGFKKARFNIIWANEYDRYIWETYEHNHKKTTLDKRSIIHIPSDEIPKCLGVIGGPPCQSWSNAGKGLGFNDPRGRLFDEFVRVLEDKQPLFFLAENVEGMMAERHKESFEIIKARLENAGKIGYEITVDLLDAADYGVPQNRKRVFFVGYRKDLKLKFQFPKPITPQKTVKEAISDLTKTAIPGILRQTNGNNCFFPNHEYLVASYSYIYMSRNRVLSWNKPSYTIQASGRQVSIHPQAPKMQKVEKDVMKFDETKLKLYRRLSVRECARIQTFPDNFIFKYTNIDNGYKMVGNAVPVELGFHLAKTIYRDISKFFKEKQEVKKWQQLNTALKQRQPALV